MGRGVGGGMLYYATEPNDNPHYIEFLRIWHEETDYKLCTSTARYDLSWIEDLNAFYSNPTPSPWPRISVLSRHIMERIHKHFTPEQLLYAWLLPQQIEVEDERAKVPGGREKYGMEKLKEVRDCRYYTDPSEVDVSSIPQGSIACVSGFRINMVEKTITITSPCFTSEKWPKGYRDFCTISYQGIDDFRIRLDEAISISMSTTIDDDMVFQWRDDLQHRSSDDGFVLVSPCRFHYFTGSTMYVALDRIMRNRSSYLFSEVVAAMLHELPEHNIFVIRRFLERFFESGFIDEVISPSSTT
jgi:hypothetical protein